MPTPRHDPLLLVAIGLRLRAAREAKGWTQADVAEAIGIEPETLSRYEAGVRGPSVTVLAHAAKALGTTLPALLPTEEPDVRPMVRPEIARVVHLLDELDAHDLKIAARVVAAIANKTA